jgi:hypothetical protein
MALTLASMFWDFSAPGPIAEVKGRRTTSSTRIILTAQGSKVTNHPGSRKGR